MTERGEAPRKNTQNPNAAADAAGGETGIDAFLDALWETPESGAAVLIACLFQNERPLRGVSGRIDWELKGLLSGSIRRGEFTGKEGECAYIPVATRKGPKHLLLVGAGYSDEPGLRKPPSEAVLSTVLRNLKSLGFARKGFRVAIHAADFGLAGPEESEKMRKTFEGVDLWITT